MHSRLHTSRAQPNAQSAVKGAAFAAAPPAPLQRKKDELMYSSLPRFGWSLLTIRLDGGWCDENTAKTGTAEKGGGERWASSKIFSRVLNGLSRERGAQAAVQPAVQPSAHLPRRPGERHEKQEATTYRNAEYQEEEASTWNENRRKDLCRKPSEPRARNRFLCVLVVAQGFYAFMLAVRPAHRRRREKSLRAPGVPWLGTPLRLA